MANKTKNQSQIRIEFKENESKTDTTKETLLLFNTARFFFLFLFSLTKNSDAANWRSTAQNQPSANCYLHLPKLNENSICLVIMITTTATSVYNGVLRRVKKKMKNKIPSHLGGFGAALIFLQRPRYSVFLFTLGAFLAIVQSMTWQGCFKSRKLQ